MVVFFISLIALCLTGQAFFTMMEMAVVSMDRVRLEYYVEKGSYSALIIKTLLEKPALFFTTTLLGVNLFLQIGSECSRLLFTTLHCNPNFSFPLQVLLTLILAEFTPLMIARQFPDTVAFMGARALYAAQLLFYPIIFITQKVTGFIEMFLPKNRSNTLFSFTRNEFETLMSQGACSNESLDLARLIKNLSNLKNRSIEELMTPIKKVALFSCDIKAQDLREALKKEYYPFVLLYMGKSSSIIGIVFTRDLLKHKTGKIDSIIQPAWFLTTSTPLKMLKLFRENRQKIAIVLNKRGEANGVLTLKAILSELLVHTHKAPHIVQKVLNKHFSPEDKIQALNRKYNLALPENKGDRLFHLFGAFAQNPLHFGNIRLTKKEEGIHIETLNM